MISKTNLDPVAIETTKNNINRRKSKFVLFSFFISTKQKDKTEREDNILGFQIIPLYLPENKYGLINNPTIIIKAITFIIIDGNLFL